MRIETNRKIPIEFEDNIPNESDSLPAYLVSWLNYAIDKEWYPDLCRQCCVLLYDEMYPEDIKYVIKNTLDPLILLENFYYEGYQALNNHQTKDLKKILAGVLNTATGFLDGMRFNTFLSFEDFIEFAYYKFIMNGATCLPVMPFQATGFFILHAGLLKELGDYDEAEEILNSLLKCCPTNARIYIELGMTYERKGDKVRAMDFFMQAFNLSWKKEDIGTVYCSFARLLAGIHPDISKVCYLMSQSWSDIDEVNMVIAKLSDREIETLNKNGKKLLEAGGIPFGANSKYADLIIQYAEDCLKNSDLQGALRYFNIAYNMTFSDDIEKRLNKVENIICDLIDF